MAGLVAYNFTIDDASPVLTYAPYSDSRGTSGQGDGLQNGWQTWYTGSGYISSSDGPSPVGESFHLTSLSGASVTLSFYGTGVALYGLSNCSYDVTFDGSLLPNATAVQGVLFSTSNKEPGAHNISMTARPDSDDQILSFNRALVTSVANSTTAAPVTLTIDNQNTSAISYAGDWDTSKFVSNIPSSASPAPFHSSTASGASAAFNFSGRAVALYGSSTTHHGQYVVTLDEVKQVLNGSSQWLLGNMLMFYQDGLDENSTHSLNITNLNDGNALSLSSVQITQFDSATADSPNTDAAHAGASRVGAIVGPVIAFVMIASVIGLYIWTKRRDKRAPSKLERRSSIASSIFLPQRFRRKYNGSDAMTPYFLNLRPSQIDTRGSIASSDAGVPYTYGAEYVRDVKSIASLHPGTDAGDSPSATARRRSSVPIPATYLPSELTGSRNDKIDSSDHLHGPTYPPPTHPDNFDVVSPVVMSGNSSLVELVVESVTQRIEAQRSSPNSARARSIDDSDLPPYPEDV